MTPFEEQLKQALTRQEPSADFTARVLARCAEADARKQQSFWKSLWSTPVWRLSVASATAVLLLATGGGIYEHHEREVKGLAAKRQLLLAMHIAGSKLDEVRQRVNESQSENKP